MKINQQQVVLPSLFSRGQEQKGLKTKVKQRELQREKKVSGSEWNKQMLVKDEAG